MKFDIILASTLKHGIGKAGGLPWKLPKEMTHFKFLTSNTNHIEKKNAVIMGRTTWESIPDKFKPLQNRFNIIISKTLKTSQVPEKNCFLFGSLDESLGFLKENQQSLKLDQTLVIGGRKLYEDAFSSKYCRYLHLTRIGKIFECDVFLPENYLQKFHCLHTSKTFSDGDVAFDHQLYLNKNNQEDYFLVNKPTFYYETTKSEEFQYLELIKDVIATGVKKDDRTGVGTQGKFGALMTFDLNQSFPLLTTKKIFWRGVVEELLWFIKGSTNSNLLSEKGIQIWDGNGSREFLDSLGLQDREVGDLGPVYGFQWRHFGAQYKDMHTDYRGQGVDQLQRLISDLKSNPNSRRHIMSAWNPSDLPKMALPPCHVLSQFYVENGELSCLMYQRSCDMGLGIPFNIASYSLLTCMIAEVCQLKRGKFVHVLGDYHVYNNHIEQLTKQIKRTPNPFPCLKIANKNFRNIEEFKSEDFELIGYQPQDQIKMKMAV